MAISGLSPKDLAKYEADAKRLIAKFDTNNDGVVDQKETTKYDGKDYWTYTNRIGSSDFVTRTTIYYDKYRGIYGRGFFLRQRLLCHRGIDRHADQHHEHQHDDRAFE